MESIKDIRNRALKTLGNMHSLERVALCLNYQVGDLTKAVYRTTWAEAVTAIKGPDRSRSDSAQAWRYEARLAAADSITQLRLLVNELGLDWDETVALGEKHHREVLEQVALGTRD